VKSAAISAHGVRFGRLSRFLYGEVQVKIILRPSPSRQRFSRAEFRFVAAVILDLLRSRAARA
jgi:hypothetical protein